ncbi:MAG TPA: DUF2461 domain-containing protein [Bacteroidales bacterium]|nr:DUF2461 domain-containing protein [Bacteroidales bacterium]HQI70058.1 DUF2461 domain-containing protein [Bacteroidales bacterium]
MITTIIAFLEDLSANNNREWFENHKSAYEKALADFFNIIANLHKEISVFDEGVRMLNPKDCIFRIYRDMRFSKDKSPYKTNFGAYMNLYGKKVNNAGYYFHLEPGNCFLCGGVYMPPAPMLKLLRNEVYYNFDEFRKIIDEKNFRKLFGEVSGDTLQKVPAGFPRDFEGAGYLRLKDFLALHRYDPLLLDEKELVPYVVKVFKAMKPLNDFLNRALEG